MNHSHMTLLLFLSRKFITFFIINAVWIQNLKQVYLIGPEYLGKHSETMNILDAEIGAFVQ